MNFTIKKEKLLNVLQIADKAITPFCPQPFFKGIFIDAKNDSITFITSDNQISIKTTLIN